LVDCRLIFIGGNHHCGGNQPVLGIINVEAIFVLSAIESRPDLLKRLDVHD
jgi:hypothetical protein